MIAFLLQTIFIIRSGIGSADGDSTRRVIQQSSIHIDHISQTVFLKNSTQSTVMAQTPTPQYHSTCSPSSTIAYPLPSPYTPTLACVSARLSFFRPASSSPLPVACIRSGKREAGARGEHLQRESKMASLLVCSPQWVQERMGGDWRAWVSACMYCQSRMSRNSSRGTMARIMNWNLWYQIRYKQGTIFRRSFCFYYLLLLFRYYPMYRQAKLPLNSIASLRVQQLMKVIAARSSPRARLIQCTLTNECKQRWVRNRKTSMQMRYMLRRRMLVLDFCFSITYFYSFSFFYSGSAILEVSSSQQQIYLSVLVYQLPNLITAGTLIRHRTEFKARMPASTYPTPCCDQASYLPKVKDSCFQQSTTAHSSARSYMSRPCRLKYNMQNSPFMPSTMPTQYLILQELIQNICRPSFTTYTNTTTSTILVNDDEAMVPGCPQARSTPAQMARRRGTYSTSAATKQITRSYSSAMGYSFTWLYCTWRILISGYLGGLGFLAGQGSSSGGRNRMAPRQKKRKLGLRTLRKYSPSRMKSSRMESKTNMRGRCPQIYKYWQYITRFHASAGTRAR